MSLVSAKVLKEMTESTAARVEYVKEQLSQRLEAEAKKGKWGYTHSFASKLETDEVKELVRDSLVELGYSVYFNDGKMYISWVVE